MFKKLKSMFGKELGKKSVNVKSRINDKKQKAKKSANKESKISKKDSIADIEQKENQKAAKKNDKIDASKNQKKEAKKDEKTSKNQRKNIDSDGEDIWPNKVRAIVIVELMGAPKEHIENTMQLYVERINEDENIIVEHKDISEIEQKEKFFLQFAEIEMTFKSVKNLIEFCFDYMPSSIEIVDPINITYTAQNLSDIMNDLQAKLHQLDMVVKNLRAENKILNENANLILRNLILVSLDEEKTIDELVKKTGINKDAVENYLNNMVDAGLIVGHKGKYKKKSGR